MFIDEVETSRMVFFYKFVTATIFLNFDVYLDGFYVCQACRLVPCHFLICWNNILI